MTSRQSLGTEFHLDQLKPLIGGVVVGTARSGEDKLEDEPEFFGISIRGKDGKLRHLFFLTDDEGNGPGSFDIMEEGSND